jgi:hypothetical protein
MQYTVFVKAVKYIPGGTLESDEIAESAVPIRFRLDTSILTTVSGTDALGMFEGGIWITLLREAVFDRRDIFEGRTDHSLNAYLHGGGTPVGLMAAVIEEASEIRIISNTDLAPGTHGLEAVLRGGTDPAERTAFQDTYIPDLSAALMGTGQGGYDPEYWHDFPDEVFITGTEIIGRSDTRVYARINGAHEIFGGSGFEAGGLMQGRLILVSTETPDLCWVLDFTDNTASRVTAGVVTAAWCVSDIAERGAE